MWPFVLDVDPRLSEDIGEMACWLLSARARSVTGTALMIGGSQMAS